MWERTFNLLRYPIRIRQSTLSWSLKQGKSKQNRQSDHQFKPGERNEDSKYTLVEKSEQDLVVLNDINRVRLWRMFERFLRNKILMKTFICSTEDVLERIMDHRLVFFYFSSRFHTNFWHKSNDLLAVRLILLDFYIYLVPGGVPFLSAELEARCLMIKEKADRSPHARASTPCPPLS